MYNGSCVVLDNNQTYCGRYQISEAYFHDCQLYQGRYHCLTTRSNSVTICISLIPSLGLKNVSQPLTVVNTAAPTQITRAQNRSRVHVYITGVSDNIDFKSCALDDECATNCTRTNLNQYAALCQKVKRFPNFDCADFAALHYEGYSGPESCGHNQYGPSSDRIEKYWNNLTTVCECSGI